MEEMNTNIYIPKRINVGYQNRTGTYTGKLAYVIYYDEHNKLRKEASWNSWRDESIPNDEYDNEPMEGFVLNKNVGGVQDSWSHYVRNSYVRIYDPRGFEFEITIPNLLWILENCNCIKGKGLEGEFVYGWDGKDLVLVPVESPDYKVIKAQSEIINKAEYIKSSDLIIGATYQGKDSSRYYVYLGRFDAYKESWNSVTWNGMYNRSTWHYTKEDDGTYHSDPFDPTRYKYINRGKHYWFMECSKSKYSDTTYECLTQIKNIKNRFIKCIDDKCSEKYIEYVNRMETSNEFSPIDFDNVVIEKLPYQTFEKILINLKCNSPYSKSFYTLNKDQFGCYKNIKILYGYNTYYFKNRGYYISDAYEKNVLLGDIPEDISFKEVYDRVQPIYGIYYLKNGKEYKRKGWYNEDGTAKR